MKQSMKRSIIMTIIYCMGMGGLSFFIGALYPSNNTEGIAEVIKRDQENVITSVSNNDDSDINTGTDNDSTEAENSDINYTPTDNSTTADATPTSVPTPEPTLIPEPQPVYELMVGGYPKIDDFFDDYYVAWNSADHSLLKTLATNPDNIVSSEALDKETLFIDDIRDTTYYVKKSYEDDAYIVYVYYEIKYVNIKTTLPRMDKFYLITDEKGNLKIYNDKMDEALKTYFDERDNDEIISGLLEGTNENAKTALEKDKDLRLYIEALYNR